MICSLCGKKMKLIDFDISFSNSFEDDLKEFNAYTTKKVLGSGNYCPYCTRYYKLLKNGNEEGYQYFKNVIKSNNAHVNINLQNFDKLVEYYSLRVQLKTYVEEAQNLIKKSCGSSLVFPKLPENNHFCAMRQGNNLVMYENFNPEFHFDEKIQYTKDILQEIKKSGDENLFMITTIPLENILSYQLIGNIEHTTITSGGGGGGGQPNLYGAVIGGLLFGGAGAIIGSQTGIHINPIKSDIVENDSRVTILNLKNSEGQAEIRELPYYYSEVFMKVIPEKEFNFIQAQNTPTQRQTQNAPARNIVEEIKQLKELLDLGLITQEEFDAKKKQILNL